MPLQDSSFRGLVALGIAAVGSTSTSAFGATDAERFTGLTTTSAQLGANGEAVALHIYQPDAPLSAATLSLALSGRPNICGICVTNYCLKQTSAVT